MTKEKAIEKKIRAYLYRLPQCWHYKVHDAGTAGLPDIIGCYKGRFFGLEIKQRYGRVRKIQRYMLDKISNTGGMAKVVRSVKEAQDAIKKCGSSR